MSGRSVSKRALELSASLAQANREIIAVVEPLSAAQWRTRCPNEGWSVGAVAHHVAEAYPFHMHIFHEIGSDRPVSPVKWQDLDRLNAAHADAYANCGRADTVDLLRRNGQVMTGWVEELSDEQLRRTGRFIDDLPAWTLERWIEAVMLGHIRGHLESIRAATGLS